MTAEPIETRNPLVLEDDETLDDLMPEIAGELLTVVNQTPAAAAKTLRLIGDQLRHIGGAGDTVAVTVSYGQQKRSFKTEAGARRFLAEIPDELEAYHCFVTILRDTGGDQLHSSTESAQDWLKDAEDACEPAGSPQ